MPQEGLYSKSTIIKNETGEEVTEPCFVLKPESDYCAKFALSAYAWLVEIDNPELSSDLKKWIDDIEKRGKDALV